MNTLKKIDAEIITMSFDNDEIFESIDKKLVNSIKKIGFSSFLAMAAFVTAGIGQNANAMDNTLKGMLAASTLAGVASNGNHGTAVPPGCPVRGANGWKVGAGGAIGAGLGHQVGNGSGKRWATAVGGLLGVTAAATSEAKRIERECNAYYAAANRQNGGMPNEDIIYQGRRNSDNSTYNVFASNSVGIAVMTGRLQAGIPLNSADPMIRRAMDQTAMNLEQSYRQFEETSQRYSQRIYGQVQNRYDVNQHNSYESNQNRQQLEIMKYNFDVSYQNYAVERAKFIHMADNAAFDNVDIRQYAGYLNYMQPPNVAKAIYNGNLQNKYVVLPNARIR
jgi:hypothetical protein